MDYKNEFDEILEESSDILLTLDQNWTIIRGNRSFFENSILSPEKQVGKNFFDLYLNHIHNLEQFNFWIYYHIAMEQRVSLCFEDYFVPLKKWTIVTVYPKTEGGLNIFIRDNSDKKEKEEALKEKSDILDCMSDGFFTVDSDWMVTNVNKQFEKVVDIDRSRILGKNFLEFFFASPVLKKSLFVKTYTHVMNSRVPANFVDYYEPLDIWTAVKVYPKSRGGIVVFFRDITEERKIAHTLKEAIIARDTFLGIASHELNTPLTSLKLQAQITEKTLDSKGIEAFDESKLRKVLHSFLDQTNRLSRLVNDMLDVSKIESGKLRIKPIQADVSAMVHNIIDRYQTEMSAEIKLNVSIEAGIFAHIDLFRVEQVVVNLISNAIKYAPGKLDIKLRKQNDFFVFTVKDYGPGISLENQYKIFEKFERRNIHKDVTGLGLGLYISKQIVDAHGGELFLESKLGEGSEFKVKIPITSSLPLPPNQM